MKDDKHIILKGEANLQSSDIVSCLCRLSRLWKVWQRCILFSIDRHTLLCMAHGACSQQRNITNKQKNWWAVFFHFHFPFLQTS